jgi:hypothetical protein
MMIGRVAIVQPVPLATTWARATGVAEPAVLVGVVEVVLLAAACAGCTGAATPVDVDGGAEEAPWATALDPGD